MSEDTKTPKFNAISGATRDKMSKRDRMMYDVMQQHGEQRLQQTQAEYDRYRGYRVRKEEDRLYGQLQAKMNAPRPKNAPQPRMPSIDEIRQAARSNVDQRHEQYMQRVKDDVQLGLDKHVQKALGRDRSQQIER